MSDLSRTMFHMTMHTTVTHEQTDKLTQLKFGSILTFDKKSKVTFYSAVFIFSKKQKVVKVSELLKIAPCI